MNATLPIFLITGLITFAAPAHTQAAESGQSKETAPGTNAPSTLHVEGRLVKDAAGRVVRLRGVNIASLEWSNTGEHVAQSMRVAIEEWRANLIRLPLSQDRWFGRAGGQSDGGARYRQIVAEAVQAASTRGGYVLLDLHWSNAGEWGQHIAQHKMPDEHSLTFWKAVAETYANHPAVLFDLYNEPRDVSWDVWKHGGQVTEKLKSKGQETQVRYQSPGLQRLVETVRSAGARNLIVANGLDWGYDLSGVLKGYALEERGGNGLMYGSHIYPWKGLTADRWEPKVGVVAAKHPVLIGEVGCDANLKEVTPAVWAARILQYIEQRELHWTAWCFHPSAGPRMLLDWNYQPTPYWGVFAKEALKAQAK